MIVVVRIAQAQIDAEASGPRGEPIGISAHRVHVDRITFQCKEIHPEVRGARMQTAAGFLASASGVVFPAARKPSAPAPDTADTSSGAEGPPAMGARANGAGEPIGQIGHTRQFGPGGVRKVHRAPGVVGMAASSVANGSPSASARAT